MEIIASQLAKRYSDNWIINSFSHTFSSGSVTGVSGINGSGKSTLLRMLSGYLSPSEGSIEYSLGGESIPNIAVYRYVSFAAPYIELVSEFTLREMYDFHTQFKPLRAEVSFDTFTDVLDLEVDPDQPIRNYSSGMAQKLQLALTVMSDTSLLLLDEPTSYLDDHNKTWFYDLLSNNLDGRTTVIASNDNSDFQYCTDMILL